MALLEFISTNKIEARSPNPEKISFLQGKKVNSWSKANITGKPKRKEKREEREIERERSSQFSTILFIFKNQF